MQFQSIAGLSGWICHEQPFQAPRFLMSPRARLHFIFFSISCNIPLIQRESPCVPKWKMLDLFCRIVAALILAQTLFFKFSAAPESRFIFAKLGAESWGRIGSGLLELVAVILLFFPGSAHLGAGIALAAMTGAVVAHIFFLGIEVRGDGGLLFFLAIVTALCSSVVLVLRRAEIQKLIRRFYAS